MNSVYKMQKGSALEPWRPSAAHTKGAGSQSAFPWLCNWHLQLLRLLHNDNI